MYDPTIGQFISEDPIAFDAGDPNLYRYVGNSPTNATDPSGLEGIPQFGDTRTVPFFRESPDVPGLMQVGQIDQVYSDGFLWWNCWRNQGRPYGLVDVDQSGYAHINGMEGAYIAVYRQPADPFLLVLGDLPDRRAGEGWPAFPGSVLGPPGVIIGASKAPGIPFTYPLPASGVISKESVGYILESMRAAELLLRTQGRMNELQAQQAAIKRLTAIARHLGWPTDCE